SSIGASGGARHANPRHYPRLRNPAGDSAGRIDAMGGSSQRGKPVPYLRVDRAAPRGVRSPPGVIARRERQSREHTAGDAGVAVNAGGPEGRGAFGVLLRRHRLAAGLTQEALAERAGLGVRTIQGLEEGESRPRRATLRRLAAALALPEEQR